MEEKHFTYKSNQIIEFLPPCNIDLNYLIKLHNILVEINNEAAKIETSTLQQQPNQTQEEFEKLKEYCRNLFKISIQIFGSKGKYIFSESSSIFDETKLPDRINRIIFDNSLKYSFLLKKELSNKVKIEFDFQKPKVFDLQSIPSLATPNNSSIHIIGNNETWVFGTYKKVMDSLVERSTKRGWLHKNNVYDLLLWFLIIPMTFRILYKIDNNFLLRFENISTIFVVAIYLYLFIFIINIFRMIFNYARWIFPKIELVTSLKNGARIHRLILTTILISLLASFIGDLVKLIFK